jgi:small multidrug resistance pump
MLWPWLLLLAAILLEVAGTTSMKLAEGFTRPLPSVLIFVCYGLSFTLMTYVLKRIDVTVIYPVWSGIGTLAIAVIGVWWFGEAMTWVKAASIGLIVLGVIGLTASA